MCGVVKVRVGPAYAVHIGRVDAVGVHEIELTQQMLDGLGQEERAELASVLTGERPLDGITPDWPSVVAAIRRRVEDARSYAAAQEERRREEAAALRAVLDRRETRCMIRDALARASQPLDRPVQYSWEEVLPRVEPSRADPPPGWDEWVASLRAESEARRRAAEAAAIAESIRLGDEAREAAARRDEYVAARSVLVAEVGDENQRARLAEGLLPDEEADAIVRDHLFAPVDETAERFVMLRPWDVHGPRCEGDDDVRFSSSSPSELSASQYEALQMIRAAAARIDGAEVEPRIHTGHCHRCGEETSRVSALVTVRWHGHRLSREYRLG